MEDEEMEANAYLIQPVWAESRACTLHWSIVYWRDFLPEPTGSAV